MFSKKRDSIDSGLEEDKIIEKMVRKVYHDGANIFGPLREIISMKLDSQIKDYLLANISYYLSLLKNLRFYYRLVTKPYVFEKEEFMLSDLIKKLFLDLKYYNPTDIEMVLNVKLYCPEEAFFILMLNIFSNAYRFGDDVCINFQEESLVVENTIVSPISDEISSLYELSVSSDKFGILGTGVGLWIIKEVASYLDIAVIDEVKKDKVKVVVNFSSIAI